jgi:hypothetical protein
MILSSLALPWESSVNPFVSLFLILLVTAVTLTAFLYVGAFFFQGYIYLEPSQQLYWQAPAAALLLTFGYTLWCLSIALSTGANPQNIPIDTLNRFSAKEEMSARPAKKVWAIRVDRRKTISESKQIDGERVEYESKRDSQTQFKYVATLSGRPWPFKDPDIIAIELENPKDGTKVRFNLIPTEQGQYRQFVSPDGWVMYEYDDGPTVPTAFRFWRLVLNVIFNFGHFFGWFLGLWVILRFQWAHALGFAVVLWVVATLTVLPMMLTFAASVAASRGTPTAWITGLWHMA